MEDRAALIAEALAAREEFKGTGLAYDVDDVSITCLEISG
jgi:hypothetical protein